VTPIPLKHQEVASALAAEIRSGRVRRGSRLPSEMALARRFAVSRATVRSALADLSDAGLIATRNGKGSFVLFDGRPLDCPRGWAAALDGHGVRTCARVLRLVRVRDEELAARVGAESPEFVLVERVRELHGGPAVSLERSHLPAVGSLAELPERGLPGGSITAALSAAGLETVTGTQRIGGRPLTAPEARALGRPAGTWFLLTVRVGRTAAGALVEHVESLLDPGHFELAVSFPV
jgi:GntR family transcriptional regulator